MQRRCSWSNYLLGVNFVYQKKVLGGWDLRASCRPHLSDQSELGKYSRDNPPHRGVGKSIMCGPSDVKLANYVAQMM